MIERPSKRAARAVPIDSLQQTAFNASVLTWTTFDHPGPDGRTALCRVVIEDREATLIDALLAWSADVNARNRDRRTPLHCLAERRHRYPRDLADHLHGPSPATAMAQRAHDRGWDTWWLVGMESGFAIVLMGIAGVVRVAVGLAQKGDPRPNRYGGPP